ncbi:protease complex subunit PrcB family protein [Natroniella sulfidigena]|uniref:protease complex subunit PrcB family protein n=1 Tax=Natroniella sulfidigena TaxID=723921 RepID=UPI00200B2D8A|nr:protease complex subunit PrcB family protein [Natroniella sulfidigena]MCK8817825.1 protease complex subunit PrcB family protein [Natroniella sulfidigena]
MKLKLAILLALVMLLVVGCNERLLEAGDVIYEAPDELTGEWQRDEYPEDSQFLLIDEQEGDELRGFEDVDFDHGPTVYASLGERPTGGYGIQINQVRRADDALIVVVKAVGPGPSDMVTQAITYPHDLVELEEEELEGVEQVVFIDQEGEKIELLEL